MQGYKEWLEANNKRVCDESEKEYREYVEGEIYGGPSNGSSNTEK